MRRRSFLTGALATGALATGAVAPLSACSQATPTSPEPTSGSTRAAAPAFEPFAGPTPDLAGTAEGVAPGFYHFPDDPIRREGYPLPQGPSFTGLLQGVAPPTPPSDNRNYAEAFTTLGTTYDLSYAGYAADYLSKFQVTMAGGDLPDLCMVVPVAQLPSLLEQKFADLTDVLSGDNIKKYPALANIPTPTWQIATVNGRIWGVAQPRPPAGLVVSTSQLEMEARGLGRDVTLRDGADFVSLLKDLTNTGKGQFAMGADPVTWLMPIIQTMVGTPNVWRNDNGTFVHEIETEEMKEALARAAEIVRAGYLHPQSFSDPTLNQSWWTTGVTVLYSQSYAGWGALARANPTMQVGNLDLPQWSGDGFAKVRKSPAGYADAFVGLKKASDDRIDQLLKIIDYFASPFGTQQYLDVSYGIEGYSYTRVDGEPVRTPDTPVPAGISYAGANSLAVIYGGPKEMVDAQHAYLSRVIPDGVANPAQGLYSETAVTKQASSAKEYSDTVRNILQGRQQVSEWDDYVKRWKDKLGNAMAAEYAEAAASA